jgi:hypothetical protein
LYIQLRRPEQRADLDATMYLPSGALRETVLAVVPLREHRRVLPVDGRPVLAAALVGDEGDLLAVGE